MTSSAGRHVFVLIATGSPVANLVPVCELGQPEDAVVWILSPIAREQAWHVGVRDVLRNRGLAHQGHILVSDISNPIQVQRALRKHLRQWLPSWQKHYQEVVLIANGGTKPTLIGAYLGLLRELRTLKTLALRVVYGEALPLRLWDFGDLDRLPVWQPYSSKRSPTLIELFQAARVRARERTDCGRLWPDPDPERAAIRQALQYAEQPTLPPPIWDGTAYECYVAGLVLHYLRILAPSVIRDLLKELWLGVDYLNWDGSKVISELDVAIVLTGGAILHLECKSSRDLGRNTPNMMLRGKRDALVHTLGIAGTGFVVVSPNPPEIDGLDSWPLGGTRGGASIQRFWQRLEKRLLRWAPPLEE